MAEHLDVDGLTSDQVLIRDNIRRYLKQNVTPLIHKAEADKRFPYQVLDGLADFGYLGGCLPEEAGGLGLDFPTWAVMMEETGYCWLSLRVIINTLNIVSGLINAYGSEEQSAYTDDCRHRAFAGPVGTLEHGFDGFGAGLPQQSVQGGEHLPSHCLGTKYEAGNRNRDENQRPERKHRIVGKRRSEPCSLVLRPTVERLSKRCPPRHSSATSKIAFPGCDAPATQGLMDKPRPNARARSGAETWAGAMRIFRRASVPSMPRGEHRFLTFDRVFDAEAPREPGGSEARELLASRPMRSCKMS